MKGGIAKENRGEKKRRKRAELNSDGRKDACEIANGLAREFENPAK